MLRPEVQLHLWTSEECRRMAEIGMDSAAPGPRRREVRLRERSFVAHETTFRFGSSGDGPAPLGPLLG